MTFAINLRLPQVVGDIKRGAERGVTLATEHLLTESNTSVPHDEGTLERTGTASHDGTRGAVSYDGPYAARQHEDMTLHHQGKGRSKWLEQTMAEEAGTVGKIIQTAIRQDVGT